jgi:hypothetical protein
MVKTSVVSLVSFAPVAGLTFAALGLSSACGNAERGYASVGNGNGASSSGGGPVIIDVGDASLPLGGGIEGGGGCTGLQCQQHACAGGGTTTLSGVVYDPAAKEPLYNVVVYVPNTAVKPLPSGASCASCNALYSGDPITATLTDATGAFTLKDVPDGANIPLVIQVGKWRKQVTIPTVTACQDNPQPDKSLTLPRNGSEGDIPQIAISTGGYDSLECLLLRIGVDASEYGAGPGGGGHIHIFQGGTHGPAAPNTSPPAPVSSQALWDTTNHLLPYDIVLLSCEGQEAAGMQQQALHDYASAGGRVFASHFHYSWFNSGPYGTENLATWFPGSNDIHDINGVVVTTFPKGAALAQWLGNVGALSGGLLPIKQARHNADVSPPNTPSQSWIIPDPTALQPPNASEYFSFNTPTNAPLDDAGEPAYCGRVVFSDLHVGAASQDYPQTKVAPTGCANIDLSPQEKALEFMLFDLSSCVTSDKVPPQPPPTPPPK